MKKLYFVRHGESEANAKGLFAGRWDVGLTEKGKKQAAKAGHDVVSLRIDCIVSSPLLRARQTAEIIADRIGFPIDEVIYSDLLMERDYGELQGRPWDQVEDTDFDKIPGIETTHHLIDRAKEAVNFLGNIQAENMLLIGHGTSGRVIRDQLLKQQNEIEVSIEQEIPNSTVVEWL
ncbi:MAG TPA: histidine phosphatase family protein [Candidatus Saccharimonadales bacterium]|nr:histidine phosphatase family protein [Candidatus Saccharimonadales bacterium]